MRRWIAAHLRASARRDQALGCCKKESNNPIASGPVLYTDSLEIVSMQCSGDGAGWEIQALGQPFARFWVTYYWLPVLISCSLFLFVNLPNDLKSTDESFLFYLEFSFYPALFIGAALVNSLLREKIGSTVAELCEGGSLSDEAARTFPSDLQLHLNSRGAEFLGLAGAVSIVYFYFGPGRPGIYWGSDKRVDFANVIITSIDILWGYLIGIAIWKVVATALDLGRLARKGQLRIRPFHPDNCGGLSAMGRLYFPLALILISTGLFLSGWIYYAHWINPLFYQRVFYVWEASLSAALVILIIFSMLAFMGPMIPVRRAMKDEERRSTVKVAALGQRISECEDLLLTGSYEADLEQLDDQYAKLESLQNRYRRRRRIPTWPVDLATSVKFWIGQIPLIVAFCVSALTLLEKVGALRTRGR